MKKFTPDYYYKDIYSIELDKLKKQGVKCLVFDLDNTIVPPNVFKPSVRFKALIKKINNYGFKFAIISNNNKKRVNKFCRDINVFNVAFAFKPTKKASRKLKKEFGFKGKEVAMVGDQLITDILFANRSSYISILVDPVSISNDASITRKNRKIEGLIFSKLVKKKLLMKGKYKGIK